MLYKSIAAILSVVTLAISPQAHAETFTADFSATTLDKNYLKLGTFATGVATSGGGILEFSTKNSNTLGTFGSVLYLPKITGDFTATVDIVSISSTPGLQAQLVFGNQSTGFRTSIIDYYSPVTNPANPLAGTYNIGGSDPNYAKGTFPANVYGLAPITALQLSRTGNIYTESYRVGTSGFTVWHTFEGSIAGNTGFVSLVASQGTAQPMNSDVKFSNFTVTTPVPEPETYAMLLAGLGLTGIIARRRKQK